MEFRRPSAEKSTQTQTGRTGGWRFAALLAALVTLGLGLAGCGGGSSASSNGSISGCSPSGCSSPAASKSLEVMAVKFSGCVRSHGMSDFPDPTIGSNGLPAWAAGASDRPGYQAARRACASDLPKLGPHTAAERATANAAALKYATCMRSNGVPNFPDPNGQGLIQISNATGVLDTSSPQFQTAATACKRLENGFAQQSSSAVSSPSGSGGGG